ncbi:NHLP bacteriocin system secretion protein, partial [Thermodesulfobacteriota bacterium]
LETQEEESINERKFKLEFQIEQSKSRIAILKNELKRATKITSLFDGTVVALEGIVGKTVQPGESLMTVELSGRILEARVLVSALQGKEIRPGMILQITPTTVKREEYGFMSARVTEVGDFPVSPESVNRLVNNPELVQAAMRKGPMIQVKGDLVKDPATRSGYRWSSRKGRSIRVSAGTLCTSQVIVKELAPITLVIPLLKELIGS